MSVIVKLRGVDHIITDKAAWLIEYLVTEPELVHAINDASHGKLFATWGGGDHLKMWMERHFASRKAAN